MAEVFSVRCSLHLSIPYRRRVMLGGSWRLLECGIFVGAAERLWFCAFVVRSNSDRAPGGVARESC